MSGNPIVREVRETLTFGKLSKEGENICDCPFCGSSLDYADFPTCSDALNLVRYKDIGVILTPKQYSVAKYLLDNFGTVMSKEKILSNAYGDVWGKEDPEIKIIDVLVCHIRDAFAPMGIGVITSWGKGYGISLTDLPKRSDLNNA